MKVVSSIIMLIGLFLGFIFLISAKSAPQEAISLVPIVGAYVLGRALENFSNKDDEVVALLNKLVNKDSITVPVKPSDNKKSSKPDNKSKSDKNSESDIDTKKLMALKGKLKEDQIIIQMKDTKELKILGKKVHETNKEMHLTNKYKVVYYH